MPQKAEFFTLKGMFFHKLGRNEEACDAFSQAVNQDSSLYKAWAEWASYHDTVAQESHEVDSVVNALSCYMIAASLTHTRSTCRPFLTRILWLLSLDDGTFGTSLEQKWVQERDKLPLWYFLPLIPQLLALLPTNAIRYIVFVLINVARLFPQVSTRRFITFCLILTLIRRSSTTSGAIATSCYGSVKSRCVRLARWPQRRARQQQLRPVRSQQVR